MTSHQYNLPPLGKRIAYPANREGVVEHFPDRDVRTSVAVDLALLERYDELIADLELDLVRRGKQQGRALERVDPVVLGLAAVDGLHEQRVAEHEGDPLPGAQDFSDVDAFQGLQGWPGERVPTNLALVELLAAAGLPVRAPRRSTPDDSLFFTNAVLCLKRGGMQAPVPAACFRACGRLFLRPTIDLVGPRAVAALGLTSLNALLAAYGLPTASRLRELLTTGRTFELPNGARLFPFCHPGRRGQQARSMALQLSDWARLGEWLRSGPGGAAARGRPAEG